MSKFHVFQIHPSQEDRDHINEHGWDAISDRPVMEAYMDASIKGAKGFKADNMKFYEHVATVEAEGLENAFQIGNIGPEKSITRYQAMRSISVGDILVDHETGIAHIVDSFGFVSLDRMHSFKGEVA